jgi:hypothetical protein
MGRRRGGVQPAAPAANGGAEMGLRIPTYVELAARTPPDAYLRIGDRLLPLRRDDGEVAAEVDPERLLPANARMAIERVAATSGAIARLAEAADAVSRVTLPDAATRATIARVAEAAEAVSRARGDAPIEAVSAPDAAAFAGLADQLARVAPPDAAVLAGLADNLARVAAPPAPIDPGFARDAAELAALAKDRR